MNNEKFYRTTTKYAYGVPLLIFEYKLITFVMKYMNFFVQSSIQPLSNICERAQIFRGGGAGENLPEKKSRYPNNFNNLRATHRHGITNITREKGVDVE